MEKIRPDIKKVAVTVSPDAAQIQILQQMKFDIIQMHGTLSAEALSAVELPVWYAINLSDPKEFAEKTKKIFGFAGKVTAENYSTCGGWSKLRRRTDV